MRCIEGYVCVVKIGDGVSSLERQILFGKNSGGGKGTYENIETNDLTPYESKDTAKEGQKQLIKMKNFTSVKLAKLEMTIAETEGELDELKDSKSLIIMMVDEGIKKLMGPMVEGKPNQYPLPGASLCHTNFQTYDSLKKARYLSREVNRQAQCGAPIATFQLNFLE